MDLSAFLLARIADDEQNARACQNWSECGPNNWESDPHPSYGCPAHPSVARQIAECQAKRRIVEAEMLREVGPASHYVSPEVHARISARTATTVMRLLAVSYADHPDYDEAWRP